MSSGPAALLPTFTGHVATTTDALILFEACLAGQLSHVPRRPHDRERAVLIRSGCVFIYEENASGIKRWTDGVTWSPSRILGNFLVYRELDKPFPPGEKKRAMKKGSRPRPSRPGEPYARPDNHSGAYSPTTQSSAATTTGSVDPVSDDRERSLIGSLVDSYGFKAEGLVKKTMSVTVQGVTHHLVSYYSVGDVINGQLRTPSQTESLTYVRPRVELTSKQSFRSPLEESEDLEGMRDQPVRTPGQYGYSAPPVSHPGYMAPAGSYYTPSIYGSSHSGATAGYPSGTLAMAGSYVSPPMSASPVGHRGDEYAPFQSTAFHPPYGSMNNGMGSTGVRSNIAPLSGSTMLPQVAMRSRAQQVPLYAQSSPQSRMVPAPAPAPMDSKTAAHYGRNSHLFSSNAGKPHANGHDGGSTHSSYLMKAETRDAGQHARVGPDPGSYHHHHRSHFYVNPAGTPLGHGSYNPGAGWTAQTQSHQRI